MKNTLFLAFFLLLFQISYCDVVLENTHLVERSVRIINANDFNNINIIGFVKSRTSNDETYIINSNDYLKKGYKFNTLYILAVKKSYLKNKKLDSIDWLNDSNVLKSNIQIDCGNYSLTDDIPVKSIVEFYRIVGFEDNKIILYKCKELIKFNNGKPLLLKTYTYTEKNEILNKEYNLLTDKNNSMLEIYPNIEIIIFLKALLITILIETIILFLIFKTKYKKLNIKRNLLLLTGFISSFSTLPYVWFIIPVFIRANYPYMLISELSVTIIESVIIYKLLRIDYKNAIIASIVCNLSSFIIGLILNQFNIL